MSPDAVNQAISADSALLKTDVNRECEVEYMYELLKDGIDLHVHTAPSIYDRRIDDFELLKELDSAGMGGAVIKSHYTETATRAQIANKYGNAKAKLYGAITLNHNTGGLNPIALEIALRLGIKTVWLPTFHAQNGLDYLSKVSKKPPVVGPGICVMDKDNKLLPAVHEIIDLVKQYDVILQTGHLSPVETFAVAEEALKKGVKVVITHADGLSTWVPKDMQIQLARKGAFIDKSWNNLWHGHISPEEMAQGIKEISPKQCIMTSDRGQKTREDPIEGLCKFTSALLEHGITKTEIQLMLRDNPKYLLGIE